jgi:4-hydroxy-tetrahydrodipicolinate synthase
LRPLAVEGKDNAKIHKAVDAVLVYAFMPAIKALLAHRTGYKGWQRMRPPLGDMSAAQSRKLVTAFDLIFPPSKKSK